MSEWWTYRLSSFLLFSPRTYHRLFELYNAAIFPAQVLALGLGAVLLALLSGGGPARSRWIASALSACWLFDAIAFHAWRYAKINWAATYFAWAFGVEGALLLWAAVGGRLQFQPPSVFTARAGLAILLFALAVLPLAGPILGRGWRGVEIFGVAPDPTAVGTLGILLLAGSRRRWPWMVVPVLWCAITGVTLFAMQSPDFWLAPLAAAIALALAVVSRPGLGSGPRTK